MLRLRQLLLLSAALLSLSLSAIAQPSTETVRFAERDTCSLYMDIYRPSEVSKRPAILFVFGGGFIGGERSNPYYLRWFELLNDDGYPVVTIDYRLGLKGKKLRFDLFHLLQTARLTKEAVEIGIEDLFSAVRYLADHPELGIPVDNLILAGSSAGAMISLSAEWEICNGSPRTAVLPEDFNFVGVMSFAGAIMSSSGKPTYKRAPCPQLLFHGTSDGLVEYEKTALFGWGMYGSSALAKIYAKKGYVYHIYRFKDHDHEIASSFLATFPEQRRFIVENVFIGNPLTIDALVDDPSIPHTSYSLDKLYK